MSKWFGAIFWTLVTVGMALFVYPEYTRIGGLYDNGMEGLMAVNMTAGSTTSNRMTTHFYVATLERTRVHLGTRLLLQPGNRYAVLYSPDELSNYTPQGSLLFQAYVFGRKSDSKLSVFAHNFGIGQLVAFSALEAMWILGAVLSLRQALKAGEIEARQPELKNLRGKYRACIASHNRRVAILILIYLPFLFFGIYLSHRNQPAAIAILLTGVAVILYGAYRLDIANKKFCEKINFLCPSCGAPLYFKTGGNRGIFQNSTLKDGTCWNCGKSAVGSAVDEPMSS